MGSGATGRGVDGATGPRARITTGTILAHAVNLCGLRLRIALPMGARVGNRNQDTALGNGPRGGRGKGCSQPRFELKGNNHG